MYENRYGTDWESLDAEAAIERAYALGVLAELDEGLPGEYDRVHEAVDAGPGVDMVELAYEEGRRTVADREAEDRSDRETWADAIEDVEGAFTRGADVDGPDDPDGSDDEEPPASAPPSSLSALEPPDDDPEMLEFPEFLRRE